MDDEPSSSYPQWLGKLRLGSTPSPTCVCPSPLLSRRFFRHSRSWSNVYWSPSGVATRTNQSSFVCRTLRLSRSLARHRLMKWFISRRLTSVEIHSRACCVELERTCGDL